jgi:hypothetical protein
MKQPAPVGTLINHSRKKKWHDRFLHYQHPPTRGDIEAWIDQFKTTDDKDVAARLLDSVQLVTRAEMELAFKTLMKTLPGWHRLKSKRQGEWRFVPYAMRPGESGDNMMACFRQAMGMQERYYDPLFVYSRQLPSQQLKGTDTVVLIDDFAGTGDQACKSWNGLFRELVGGAGLVYLMVVAATVQAQQEIRTNTDLQVMSHYNLIDADNLFSNHCSHFSENEKGTVLRYCSAHFPAKPKGYGDCGLLFVLQHVCPNNSIPILHSYNKDKWVPLFPRTKAPA